MPSRLLMRGTFIFGASFLLTLVLLVAHGGANKAKQFEVWGCGQNLGLVRGSSYIHTKSGFVQSSSTKNSAGVLVQSFENWAIQPITLS